MAYSYVFSNDGFGKGDVLPFAIHTGVLSTISLLLFNPLNKLFKRVKIGWGIIFALLASIIQTIAFILIVWFIFGPWIGAYSFPIHICWLLGASLANFFLLIISDNPFNTKHFGLGIGILGVTILGMLIINEANDELATEQNYDIICLVHRPSDKTPEIDDLTKFSLNQKEAKAIIDIGLQGSFWTDKYFRISGSKLISTDQPNYDFDSIEDTPGAEIEFLFGNELGNKMNENPKIIIIMNHPMESDFEFKEPIDSSAIVYQHLTEDKFEVKYLGDKKNSKKITVKETDFRVFPYYTSIVVDLKERGEFRLHGFQWLEK